MKRFSDICLPKMVKNVLRHSLGGKCAEIRQGCWRKSYSGNLSSSANPREALKSVRTALFKGMVTSTLRNIICPLNKISGSILAGSPVLTPRSSDVLRKQRVDLQPHASDQPFFSPRRGTRIHNGPGQRFRLAQLLFLNQFQILKRAPISPNDNIPLSIEPLAMRIVIAEKLLLLISYFPPKLIFLARGAYRSRTSEEVLNRN